MWRLSSFIDLKQDGVLVVRPSTQIGGRFRGHHGAKHPEGSNTAMENPASTIFSYCQAIYLCKKKSYIPMSNRSTIAASWPSKDYLPTFKTLIGLGVGGFRYIPVRCWEKQCHWILQTYIHCYFVFVQHSCSKHILIMIVNSIIYIHPINTCASRH